MSYASASANAHTSLSTTSSPTHAEAHSKSSISSLAAIWASRYVRVVNAYGCSQPKYQVENPDELVSEAGRSRTAAQALKHLNRSSAAAWALTDDLLSDEIPKHGIPLEAIDPWQIAADTHSLFKLMFQAYAEGKPPQRLSVIIGSRFGKIRQRHTAGDPRVIGFMSMHLHYTGQKLLEKLSPLERSLVHPYFKVMDDHMYMPLRDACDAAANHEMDSPALIAVQHLLAVSTTIARSVCNHVSRVHAGYETYSGRLISPTVRTSSIRDVEMFQVYLCLCTLEGHLRSVQRELFPLCVMLYPQLNVSWQLVQDMLKVLRWEMYDHLSPKDMQVFLPHLQALTEMFSPAVFQPSLTL
ncbi:MAG: hypothetical protein HY785_12375 [Oscillatoriophycideae cyanobacterium NC_groundwater_1537_Pr4_S-0.65um_50_18]|nr:hypothetical protein [Oscillatoriophycideae cyanobacterium NC_groundwater_1537_Pr4_S-0.65um_50_18]